MPPESTRCSWCDQPLAADDGWRVGELPGDRRAAFCRLEHVVPWALQGAHWEPGAVDPDDAPVEHCSHCGERLGEVRVLAVRHRGSHRIPDGFCSADHLAEWAKSGGRWR
jgi:hypothetical protein